VELRFGSGILTNFPVHYAEVGPPESRLRYRVIEPADYQFKLTTSNWTEHGQPQYQFSIHATAPGKSNAWTANPRGTVLLLHGYGLAQFAMAPWAFQLAEDGWRCVLVDLRGHGKSTGKRIFFGTRETTDMTQLLDVLKRDNLIGDKVGVVGESYGASLALRWKGMDPRVGPVVAIAPYAVLSNAVLNIGTDYAGWVPEWTVKSGLRNLPALLEVDPQQLDTISVLKDRPVPALFIAAAEDKVATSAEVKLLQQTASPGSKLIIVPDASHEAVTYYFDVLAGPVRDWLAGDESENTDGHQKLHSPPVH
jgi:pimeloyl-ACP methyl ester carboxylesterase